MFLIISYIKIINVPRSWIKEQENQSSSTSRLSISYITKAILICWLTRFTVWRIKSWNKSKLINQNNSWRSTEVISSNFMTKELWSSKKLSAKNLLPQISWNSVYPIHHVLEAHMLLPFHKVYPMQLLGTKDAPNGKGEHLVNITRKHW